MACFYHPDVEAVTTCIKCGQPVCTECSYVRGTHPVCRNCWDKRVSSHTTGTSNVPVKRKAAGKREEPIKKKAVVADYGLPEHRVAPVAPAGLSEVGDMLIQNTSGQGEASKVPAEIMGWNWGAFLFNWLWGVNHRVWISLLAFIPIPLVAFIISFVLGAKGNEWAWKKKEWYSIEHFRKTQRTWRNWGIGLVVAYIILFLLLVIVGVSSGSETTVLTY